MPIYVYRCPKCRREVEEIRPVADMDAPVLCDCGPMVRAPTTASIAFKTAGGNIASFSSSHGPYAKGNRKPKTISTGHGLGGRRPHPSPKTDPAFRAELFKMVNGRKP